MTTDSTFAAIADNTAEADSGAAPMDAGPEGEDLLELEELGDIEDIEDLEDGPDDIDAIEIDDTDDELEDDSLQPVVLAGTVTDLVAISPAEAVATPAEPDADDDVLITDEVEASLDVILAERMRARDVEVDEGPEDEEDNDETPNQLATVIPVRRPDEFLCQSCFLLKPPGQLADRDHQLCRDCA